MEATSDKASSPNPYVKLAIEVGPIAVFFIAYRMGGIFTATGAFMVAMTIAVAISWFMSRKVPIMPLVTLVMVLVFGGLTLWLEDGDFIKLKPTIVNTLFGLTLFGGLAFGQLFLKVVFKEGFTLDDQGWRTLTIRWGLFFFFLAVLNEIIWRNFSEEVWVNFKVWGAMPITIVFALCQLPVVNRHTVSEPDDVQ